MKVVISGYGKMGHMVESVLERRGLELAAALDDIASVDLPLARESVCIDFSTPDAFRANYRFLADSFKAVVVGTTGWDDISAEVTAYFESKGTPMVYSSNFSIGVNAVFAAVERICDLLKGHGYSPDIEEIHHIHKLDTPSGTAKRLGSIVSSTLGSEPEIRSIREGEVPGVHTVEFLSGVDRISITHEAFSRQGFAEGAVYAAELTEGLEGVHKFDELILK